MDHLLRPSGAENFIKVPYNVNEPEYYDAQGFFGFPQRRGWSEQDLLGVNNFGNRSDEEVESFFQTWLFFGMAIEILTAAGIGVHTKDFLHREQEGTSHAVNTEILPSLLVRWKTLWPLPEGVSEDCTCRSWPNPNQNQCRAKVCWKNFEHARDSGAWDTTSRILDRPSVFMDRYCTATTTGDEGKKLDKPVWPVREEVATSILALGFSLRAAAISIYDIPRMVNNWGTSSSSLIRRILGHKWCKSDAALVMGDLQIDGQYYVAVSPSPSQEYLDAHSECDENRCRSKVEEGMYKTKHAPGCNKDSTACPTHFCYGSPARGNDEGADGWLDPPDSPKFEQDLVRVITAGGAVKTGETFDIRLVGIPIITWDEEKEAVAIAEYNEAKGLTPGYVAISHVWLDGLGNKLINSIPKCQLSRIQRMVDEIPCPGRREGEKMGFWLDTLCVPVREPFRDAKKWSIQRMRHIYRRAAAVLVIDSWLGQISSEAPIPDRCLAVFLSNWQHRLWTFQEGCLAEQLYFRFSDRAKTHREMTQERRTHDDEAEARGVYGRFCGLSDSKVTAHFTLVKQVVGRFVTGEYSRADIMWMLYLPLADALGYRQTTNLADETLCLSTILGMDPGPYLNIRRGDGELDEKLAERRMVKFLQQIKTFNTGLIFGYYPRISRKGFRWAPRSLLNARTSTIGPIGDQLKGRVKRIGSHKGLVVEYPGTKCKLADLLSATEDNSKTFCISEEGAKRRDVYYSVEPRLPNGSPWDKQAVYGLLFAKIPKAGEECPGMIGSEPIQPSDGAGDGDYDDEIDIHFLMYECNAVVRAVSGRVPPGTLCLPFYDMKTKWMIM